MNDTEFYETDRTAKENEQRRQIARRLLDTTGLSVEELYFVLEPMLRAQPAKDFLDSWEA